MFLGSPLVRSISDLEERQMKFSEIPIHDVTRDIILMKSTATLKIDCDFGKDKEGVGMYANSKAFKNNNDDDDKKPLVQVMNMMYRGLMPLSQNSSNTNTKYLFLPEKIANLFADGTGYTASMLK